MQKSALWVLVVAATMPLVLVFGLLSFVAFFSSSSSQQCGTSAAVDPRSLPQEPLGAMGWQGEQLKNAALIMNAGVSLGLDRHDQTLAVMTAMGESSLTVLDHGDTAGPDSRGLFQQRSAGWGTLTCRMDPFCSALSFFRALMKVTERAQMAPSQAAHAVQQNADPDHYTTFWPDAQKVVAALASSAPGAATGAAADCAPVAGDMTSTIAFALTLVDKWPYSWGGGGINGPSYGIGDGAGIYGFDCSGFVQYVIYKTRHVDIGGSSRAQAQYFQAKGLLRRTNDASALQAGDVVFFARSNGASTIYHVALVTGQGWIVEAPGRGRMIQHNQISARMPDDIWGYARLSAAESAEPTKGTPLS